MNKARVIAELKAMFDEKTAVFNDVDMAKYIDDLMGVVSLPPLGVILPQSTEQVVQLIKFCNANDVYTIPQGGLTGLASAAVPIGVERSVIVSMEKMNQIHTLDVFDNSMVVDSGVILAQVQNAAKDVGRYFPLSHGGEGSSQIGGNIATNSGGNNALKYGTARDQVLGLEVVMGNGEIYSNLKGLRKNTAGLDLKHLFIGSQGKFGIITKAALKLRPYPNNRATALVGVNSPEVALKLLRDLELYLGENISAFELISDMAMNYALKVENTRFALTEKAAWYVLIEAETAAKDLPLDEAMEKGLEAAFETGDIVDAAIATTIAQRDAIWYLREAIAVAFIEDKSVLKSDTAVPIGQAPIYVANVNEKINAILPNVNCAPFGHLGDGNIHFNVARGDGMTKANFIALWPQLKKIIEDEAIKLGGTISAEHGIGALKLDKYNEIANPNEKKIMHGLSNLFNPNSIMNPNI